MGFCPLTSALYTCLRELRMKRGTRKVIHSSSRTAIFPMSRELTTTPCGMGPGATVYLPSEGTIRGGYAQLGARKCSRRRCYRSLDR
ncbi:protein kinase catalytic domain-containing protein [Histoplasma ohiense]|nr:protein kinase catalytic domain-containing protein [Histoplasma ohiense (nom. inval.)]